jgi:hypothetical protein
MRKSAISRPLAVSQISYVAALVRAHCQAPVRRERDALQGRVVSRVDRLRVDGGARDLERLRLCLPFRLVGAVGLDAPHDDPRGDAPYEGHDECRQSEA